MEPLGDNTPSSCLPLRTAHHWQDGQTNRQTEHALGQERSLNNQPKIDSLLLNLISPNWIHVSWPRHINFNYSLLMSP